MEKLEAVSLNIAILPRPGISELAINLSRKIAQNVPTEFTLNRAKFLPHITVYQAHIPISNISKVMDEVRKITVDTKSFRVNLKGFTISYDTFLFWSCVKSKDLQKLHDNLVQKVNPLREGLILPVLTSVTGMSEEDCADIGNYGALLIGPRYTPHVTITRLSNPKDAKSVLETFMRVNIKSVFAVESLVLGYLGPNGTVNGIIETYKFTNN